MKKLILVAAAATLVLSACVSTKTESDGKNEAKSIGTSNPFHSFK